MPVLRPLDGCVLILHRLGNMSNLTRQQLRDLLAEKGEKPPMRWTRVELLMRVEELTGNNQSKTAPAQEASEYHQLVSKLNAASRRKADLQTFCKNTLGMEVNFNHTIAQLQREAMLKIYARKTVPEPTDVLGFGCHADKSYAAVKKGFPEYCSWVTTTAREGQCDPRLRRFAGWLANDVNQVAQASEDLEKNFSLSESNLAPRTPKPEIKKKTSGYPTSATSSAAAMADGDSVTLSSRQLQTMVATIENLKEEVAALKGERPRKKGSTDEPNSPDSDFSMVTMTKGT